MKKLSFFFLLCSLFFVHTAQANGISAVTPEPGLNSTSPENKVSPQFPGGKKALVQFIGNRLAYPLEARESAVEGEVKVSFTVMNCGTVANPKIVNGLGYGCDEEVIRIVEEMPKWIPGMINNTTMAQQVSFSIAFELE